MSSEFNYDAATLGAQQRISMLENAKKYISAGQIKGAVPNRLNVKQSMNMTNMQMSKNGQLPKMTNMERRQLMKVYDQTRDPALKKILGL